MLKKLQKWLNTKVKPYFFLKILITCSIILLLISLFMIKPCCVFQISTAIYIHLTAAVDILTFQVNHLAFYGPKLWPACWKLFPCLSKSLWEDGMVYQGVSMAIRVICQGPRSLGLERSWLISKMKKSAVWPRPSGCGFHTHFSFSPISSSSIAALPPSLRLPFSPAKSSLCYLYLCLQMSCLSSPIILHFPNFS